MNNNIGLIFGQRLKELREQKELNQDDIAEWFKMGKSAVSQWESGRLPHATIIVDLAERFGVSTDYLLGVTDSPGRQVISHELLRKIQITKDYSVDELEFLDSVWKAIKNRLK